MYALILGSLAVFVNFCAKIYYRSINMMISSASVIKKLRSLKSQKNIEGMKRFGLSPRKVFGVASPQKKKIVADIKKAVPSKEERHKLAAELWKSGIDDARMVAVLIDPPELVGEKQMEKWAGDFDNWGICDSTCGHLFDKTPFAYKKAASWSKRREEYVKRAGFSMMAWLAVHDKKASDKKFIEFFPMIVRASKDERNFVKKAVNWALRSIGKRNAAMNKRAIRLADKIKKIDSKSARWIASGALWELKSPGVKKILERR
jgi:3-methyladenine DNA glycosylase AlkD